MIFLKLAILIIASCGASFLFRLGGRHGQWGKWRDWFANVITVLCAGMFCAVSWMMLGMSVLHWLALWLALCSYGKFLNRWFNRNHGERVDWLQYSYSGAVSGLAALPLIFCGISIWAVLGRTVALILFYNIWWAKIKSDSWSELGRGFALTASVALFAIN